MLSSRGPLIATCSIKWWKDHVHRTLNTYVCHVWLVLHVCEGTRGSQDISEPAQRWCGVLPELFCKQTVCFLPRVEYPPGKNKSRKHFIKNFLEGEWNELQVEAYHIRHPRMPLDSRKELRKAYEQEWAS